MKQVTVVGLGLIGTSLGLALRQTKTPPLVVGHDIQYDAANRASRMKAVDRVDRSLEEAVSGAELVVIATPVDATRSILETISSHLLPGCVVTDTASTKRAVIRHASELLPAHASFVGGHPMTGKATAGVDEPSSLLFRDTIYCLTPGSEAPPAAVETVASVIHAVGAHPFFVDPVEHDSLVAGISHLPYLTSAMLMRALATADGWREMSDLAAGGFELTTRLAGQDPKLFAGILASNADNVARYVDQLIEVLASTRDKLLADPTGFAAELERAHRDRTEWEEQRRRARAEGQ